MLVGRECESEKVDTIRIAIPVHLKCRQIAKRKSRKK